MRPRRPDESSSRAREPDGRRGRDTGRESATSPSSAPASRCGARHACRGERVERYLSDHAMLVGRRKGPSDVVKSLVSGRRRSVPVRDLAPPNDGSPNMDVQSVRRQIGAARCRPLRRPVGEPQRLAVRGEVDAVRAAHSTARAGYSSFPKAARPLDPHLGAGPPMCPGGHPWFCTRSNTRSRSRSTAATRAPPGSASARAGTRSARVVLTGSDLRRVSDDRHCGRRTRSSAAARTSRHGAAMESSHPSGGLRLPVLKIASPADPAASNRILGSQASDAERSELRKAANESPTSAVRLLTAAP